MGAESPRKRKQQPAWRAVAGGEAPRGAQYKWKPDEAASPGTGKRRLKQILLIGGTIGCVAAMVWLILYLRPSPKATLIAISANPAEDAERLDVPLDLYGWLTAGRFVKLSQEQAERDTGQRWGRPRESVTGEGGSPLSLPADEQGLADWANRLKNADYDPLVLYVGLHGGTTAEGPFLFTGGRDERNRPNRLPVAALVRTLTSEPLKGKKKVLILDPGRLPPEPIYGQLHDDFAARVRDDKTLAELVKLDSNLVILCGADDGQRGWESEELQATAFGYAVLRALRGELPAGQSDVITARALFTAARDKTEQWTRINRPTAQVPFLLPEGDDGLARAEKITVSVRPDTPPPAPPAAPALAMEPLKDRWQKHDALAEMSPSPALYAPRSWRRYRKLLLRYEQAVRAGEPTTAEKLRLSLDSTAETIARATALPEFESQRNSLALYAARHGGAIPSAASTASNALPAAPGERAALADQALRLLANPGGNLLPTAAASLRRFAPDQRPIEAQLPVMVDQFYNGAGQAGAAPAGWSAAFAAKRQAERTALGLPTDEQLVDADIWSERLTQYLRPQPLAERLWPVVRESVTAGDRLRREGEDRLFASAASEHATASTQLTEAQTAYRKAASAATQVRTALLVRDLVFADLPFLTRWASHRGQTAAEIDALVELWQATHKLAADLEASPVRAEAAAAEARNVAQRFARLRSAFDAELNERKTSDAALQGEWWRKQQILATPLIRAQDRAELLAASRRASGLLANSDKPPGEVAPTDTRKTDAKEAARVRGRLAWAMLGERLLDTQHADGVRPKAAFIEKDLNDLKELPSNDPARWSALAGKVGAELSRHFAELSAPSKTDARAEWFSRVAVRFDRDDGWEPAAINLRLRWRDLLDGLAERVADDHWYDEQYDPIAVANAASMVGKYYRRAAERYLVDAGRVTAGLPGVSAFTIRPELAAKLNAAPLEGGTLPRITWTSERNRIVTFAPHALPATYPITGNAVWLPQLSKVEPLRSEAAPDRSLRPLRGDAAPLAIKLALDPRVDTVVAQRTVAATLYFRGQRPTLTQQIELRRRPDLVISDPLPNANEKDAMIAVRADKALDLGTVAILIDLSGSMKGDLETNKDLSDWQTNRNSKFNIALNALEAALKDLPAKTPLRVRVFSDKQDDAMRSRSVFTTDRWDAADDLPKLMRRLRSLTPKYFTPLIDSIKTTATNEFPPGRDKTKTMIVLTDGADEQANDTPAARLARIMRKRGGMYDTLSDQGVQLFVVQVGLDSADLELSKALFGDLPGKTPPGRVWTAKDVKQLQQALQDAIRPKLELMVKGGDVPRDFPREGWPSRTTDERAGLYWSRLIPAGRYDALPSPGRRAIRTDLLLRDGDRMILGLVRDPASGEIRVRRELASGFKDLHDLAQWRKDKRWVALAPRNYIDDQRAEPQYHAAVFLEQVPSHLRPGGTFENTLQHFRPALPDALLWWDAAPAQPGIAPPGTLRIRKRYNYWAPAWDVTADNWRKTPAGYPQAKLRVWVAETLPDPLPPPADGYELNQSYKVRSPGGDLDVRLSYEAQPLLTNAKGEETETGCLVVRITYPAGHPVLAKLENTTPHHARHSYYRYHRPGAPTTDGQPGEYTALFGPFDQAELATARIRLTLMPVAPALRDENAITLTPPPPGTDVPQELDYQPRPARAAEKP